MPVVQLSHFPFIVNRALNFNKSLIVAYSPNLHSDLKPSLIRLQMTTPMPHITIIP